MKLIKFQIFLLAVISIFSLNLKTDKTYFHVNKEMADAIAQGSKANQNWNTEYDNDEENSENTPDNANLNTSGTNQVRTII